MLMIAAHPDDENTALLAYCARGRNLQTAYLSLTRGEGGQNLIGSEQGIFLGLIRTEELLAAFPNNSLAARNVAAVQAAASRDGFHSFRVANWNGEAPNFGKAVLG